MADEKEFIWIGENETCLEEIPYCYAELVQCSEEGKQELKKGYYYRTRQDDMELVFRCRIVVEKVEIKEEGTAIDLPTGEKRVLTGNRAMATSANLSKDMKHCVAGMEDGSICIWDLESGRITKVFPSSIGKICFAEGFYTFCIGQTSGIAMLWKDPYEVCSYVLEGRKSPVTLL